MRNKYGIIKLELSNVVLSDTFNAQSYSEITNILTEEQKTIIKTLGDTKIVLLDINVTDSDTTNDHIVGFSHKEYTQDGNSLVISVYSSLTDSILNFALYYDNDNDKYYIKS